MKLYYKEINGKPFYKNSYEIVISNNGMNTYNPTEEMILADGWKEYIQPVKEKTIDDAKYEKLEDLNAYDNSRSVNIFYVKGMPMWLDKATRAGLMLRFNAEIGAGKEDTSLWYEGNEFPLKLQDAINMLYSIELYASACYDNTQKHKANIDKLETIEDVEAYDFTTDYPEHLNF
jgi:hypothetical protein